MWVADYQPDPMAPATWNVFGTAGSWLAIVDVPAGLRVTDIGEDWLLGLARDSLDVEHVHLYTLRRSDAPERD